MFKNISSDIAFLLVRKRIVDNEKRKIYEYGAEITLLNTLNIVIPFVVSLIFGTMIHFVTFVLVFIPLRICIGGYHSKKSEHCVIIPTILYVLSVLLPTLLPSSLKMLILATLFVLSVLAILLCAPVENKNNTLCKKSKKMNRLFSLVLISTDSIALVITCVVARNIATSIMTFVILAGFLMFIGDLNKNYN